MKRCVAVLAVLFLLAVGGIPAQEGESTFIEIDRAHRRDGKSAIKLSMSIRLPI